MSNIQFPILDQVKNEILIEKGPNYDGKLGQILENIISCLSTFTLESFGFGNCCFI
jgi:hypothetical protein